MALHAKVDEVHGLAELEINPVYGCNVEHSVPRHRLPAACMDPDTALQLVRDELILDGNARLNLATFVTTWMEPQAGQLMADCFSKNMIDKDEYPQTAELERRCVNILAHLWHAPSAGSAPGATSRPASSSSTRKLERADNRFASTQPAAPAPTMMTSKFSAISLPVQRRPAWRKSGPVLRLNIAAACFTGSPTGASDATVGRQRA